MELIRTLHGRFEDLLDERKDDGIALLRISLGVMFIAHGLILKYFTFTLAGTAGFFASLGLPETLAYVVFAMETAGGILLVLGYGTRLVSLALVPVLVGAAWVHVGNGWAFTAPNGGWEYPVYLTVLALAQAVLGSGSYALDARR
jgi:putative oxidoreductase